MRVIIHRGDVGQKVVAIFVQIPVFFAGDVRVMGMRKTDR